MSRTVSGEPRLALHTGTSMAPVLREGDLLEFAAGRVAIRVGDVVAIVRPGEPDLLVHRVIACAAGGRVRTKGDANAFPDDWIREDAVHGRVIARWRDGVRRVLPGGRLGLLQARGRRALSPLARLVRPLLGPPYRIVASAGLLQRLVPPSWGPRVVAVRVRGESWSRLLIRGRVVGERRPGRPWSVRAPFRLLVAFDGHGEPVMRAAGPSRKRFLRR